jgi:hypothetical protein
MNNLVATLVAALTVSALTGITFLAYKHHRAYSNLFLVLFTVYFIVLIFYLTWNGGVLWTYSAISDFIQPDKFSEARAARDNIQIPFWVFVVASGASLYTSFLLYLPNLLANDKPAK